MAVQLALRSEEVFSPQRRTSVWSALGLWTPVPEGHTARLDCACARCASSGKPRCSRMRLPVHLSCP
jgi:hypothetical protein